MGYRMTAAQTFLPSSHYKLSLHNTMLQQASWALHGPGFRGSDTVSCLPPAGDHHVIAAPPRNAIQSAARLHYVRCTVSRTNALGMCVEAPQGWAPSGGGSGTAAGAGLPRLPPACAAPASAPRHGAGSPPCTAATAIDTSGPAEPPQRAGFPHTSSKKNKRLLVRQHATELVTHALDHRAAFLDARVAYKQCDDIFLARCASLCKPVVDCVQSSAGLHRAAHRLPAPEASSVDAQLGAFDTDVPD